MAPTARIDCVTEHEPGQETEQEAGRRPRWLPVGVGAVIAVVVVWAFATAWVGIWGSSPAYLITLVLSLVLAIGLVTWALVVGAPGPRSMLRVWSARVALLLGGVLVIGALVYLKPASAEPIAIDALHSGDGIEVTVSRSQIRLTPTVDPLATGLAFYPGGLVDPQAYAHVLRPVAEAGFPVVIFKQPYNLAVLDSNAADAVIGDPDDDVDRWVVGGHSLGGAMASSYAEREHDELVGLLLYAAWPVGDMSGRADLAVLSVSGTNDGLATPAEIDESKPDLPASTEYVPIEGAIHSFFGDYGLQRGDGVPTITRTDAQRQIADASVRFLDTINAP